VGDAEASGPATGPERVVLVGFMGAGKSTIGPLLAEVLGWGFVDLDTWIEERAGREVATIFREEGEASFRARERDMAARAASQRHLVIAAGGGAFAQPDTRDVLRQGAVTVWLRSDLATLLARIPPDGRRPLAANRDIMQTLLAEREPSYKLADVTVDASGKADAVAALVALEVRARGVLPRRS
jgi:shikimate kinase